MKARITAVFPAKPRQLTAYALTFSPPCCPPSVPAQRLDTHIHAFDFALHAWQEVLIEFALHKLRACIFTQRTQLIARQIVSSAR